MTGVYYLWHTIKRPALICTAGLLLAFNVAIVGLMEVELAYIQPDYTVLERIRDNARSLFISLLNAEVGVRGYIITDDSVYLTPYQAASHSLLDAATDLRQMPLSPSERNDADQFISQLDAQMKILAGLIAVQRTSGRAAAGAQLGNGQEKIGLDTLRSSFSDRIDSVTTSMLTLQRAGRTYQEVEKYCLIFTAFWLYMTIFLASRWPG